LIVTWKRRLLKEKEIIYEAPGSPLIQQSDELGGFIAVRELDCGSKRLRSFDAR